MDVKNQNKQPTPLQQALLEHLEERRNLYSTSRLLRMSPADRADAVRRFDAFMREVDRLIQLDNKS